MRTFKEFCQDHCDHKLFAEVAKAASLSEESMVMACAGMDSIIDDLIRNHNAQDLIYIQADLRESLAGATIGGLGGLAFGGIPGAIGGAVLGGAFPHIKEKFGKWWSDYQSQQAQQSTSPEAKPASPGEVAPARTPYERLNQFSKLMTLSLGQIKKYVNENMPDKVKDDFQYNLDSLKNELDKLNTKISNHTMAF